MGSFERVPVNRGPTNGVHANQTGGMPGQAQAADRQDLQRHPCRVSHAAVICDRARMERTLLAASSRRSPGGRA